MSHSEIERLARSEENQKHTPPSPSNSGEYSIGEKLYEGITSLVYRARQTTYNQPVILKLLKEPHPAPAHIEQLQREYELLSGLHAQSGSEPALEGVVQVYGLETVQHSLTLVLEDFGGESLTRLHLAGKLDLVDFLQLAIKITEALGRIHQHHLIHKNVTPANIVVNPVTGQVKLIDFGLATPRSSKQPFVHAPTLLEGTLAYISPEQTGRMHREVDQRADLYSLGATFYELLTGRVPFEGQDALELVHSHLARPPIAPHELNPGIPKPLSELVLMLLAKNPDHRYQTAFGLKTDLEFCLEQWTRRGALFPFSLAAHDVSDRFTLPQQLYGRESESATLLEVYQRVATGQTAVVLVAGAAGMGKTALVQNVYPPLTWQSGYFIHDKFAQFERDIPYSAVRRAFADLLRQVLAEGEEQLAAWRKSLLAAIGPNGRVLTDVVPQIETLLGPQPDVPELGPAERLNRFYFVFQQVLQVFTRPAQPLVLFLDDLHWADEASLRLLEYLIAETPGYLLVVGAYRDAEITETHLLLETVTRLKQQGTLAHHLLLAPLEAPAINRLVADTLHRPLEMVKPLAAFLARRTGGNPLFLLKLFHALYDEGFITFDYEQKQWDWNFMQLKEQGFARNMAALLADQIKTLPAQSLSLLKSAACAGYQFNLKVVARASAVQEAAISLLPAVDRGLIVPLPNAAHLDENAGDLTTTPDYQFAHDSIQQAIYSLISAAERPLIHAALGQALLEETQGNTTTETLFEMVDHLNLGRAALSDPGAWEVLTRLNLIAGKRARLVGAFKAAAAYLTVGQELLPADSWQTQYELTRDLLTEAIEAAYLTNDIEQAERLFDTVLGHTNTILDTIRAYEIRIQWYMAQNQMPAAIDVGLHVLDLLGVPLQTEPPEYQIVGAFRGLPPMTDPHKLAAMRVLGTFLPPALFAQPALVAPLTFTMLRLCSRYGNAPEVALAYATYGAILCSRRGDLAHFEEGTQFGNLAVRVAHQFNDPAVSYKAIIGFLILIQHFGEKASNSVEMLHQMIQSALEGGDTFIASLAAFRYSLKSFLVGMPLEMVQQRVESSLAFIQAQKQLYPLTLQQLWGEAIANLRGNAGDVTRLQGTFFDETNMLPRLQTASMRRGLFFLYSAKTFLSYLFRDLPMALDAATQADQYQYGEAGAGLEDIYQIFYSSLVFLGCWGNGDHQARYLEQVAANQRLLKAWAQEAPMNFQHKYALVEAERARVLGRFADASEQYRRAIQGAWQQGYLQDEALAYELSGEFYLSRHMEQMAQAHLRFAYRVYQRWGAEAKLKDLEVRYPHYLSTQTDAASKTTRTLPRPPLLAGSTEVHLKTRELDIPTLLKTAQAISAEVRLADVLKRLLRFALENAGAEKGVLLLEERGSWIIGAKGEDDAIEASLEQPERLESAEQKLPAEVIHYVARTHETVVLHDAAHEGYFTQAPYISKKQSKSIICLPLLNQGQLNSILYLENNLTTGAFTEERLDVLRWLSAQMAITIDNARLYQELERKVEERTQALQEEIAERKRVEQALREAIDAAQIAKQEAETAKHEEEKRRQEAERRRQIAESLRDIVSILNSNRPLDEVLAYIVSQAGRLLGNQAAAVYSRHRETGEVVIQAEQGLPTDYIASVRFPENQQALRRAMLHPHPVAIPDLTLIATSKDPPASEQSMVVLPSLLTPYRALLGVPIVIKHEVYGHVRLYYAEPRAFSEEEIELALMFSDQVALAIENARLTEQVKQVAIIDERHRLARDLHDAVTQTIFSASLIAEALPRLWEYHPKEARYSLEELRRLIQGALVEMRTLLLELRPAAITEKKFGELLKQLTETVTSQTQIATTLTVEGDRVLPIDVQITLYRIAQEALNNILKHARASQISVKLQCQPEEAILRLSDNGHGFDPDSLQPDQLGLNIMRERALNIGAIFKLSSQPGRGTDIQVIWSGSGLHLSNASKLPKERIT